MGLPEQDIQPSDTLSKPISVFISSSQKEFESIRQQIKEDLDELKIADRKSFATTLVEMERGQQIEHDVEDSLKLCDIYVLLVGSRYSEWTEKEFKTAWSSGLPIKAYLVKSPKTTSQREAQKQKKFLKLLESRIRLQGKDRPYSRDSRYLLRLYNDIANDLASVVMKGIHEYVEIKRVIRR